MMGGGVSFVLALVFILASPADASSSPSYFTHLIKTSLAGARESSDVLARRRKSTTIAFQLNYPNDSVPFVKIQAPRITRHINTHHGYTIILHNNMNDDDTSSSSSSSFLSTNKANVSFKNSSMNTNNKNVPSNLSSIDKLLLTLTSDRTSLLLGSLGILLLLLNRLLSFPEDAIYEASRSRIDLLAVFAAGSVLLNGITKLDVESVVAEQVVLDGINQDGVVWNEENLSSIEQKKKEKFQATAEWALSSFLKCTPARTAVLLATQQNTKQWMPLATTGILPSNPKLRTPIPESAKNNTPILDRMLREDGNIKGGTVGGTEVVGGTKRKGPKESYLPTLQALPGRVEFTYLPTNAQEALILPVPRPDDGKGKQDDGEWYYAIVLGGDTAKSFAPRDIAWSKEIASMVGDFV